jgi:amidohydrolase
MKATCVAKYTKRYIFSTIINKMKKQLLDALIGIRRQLHAHPELGFCEIETSALIRTHLTTLSIPFVTVAGTGVIGTLSKGEGPTIVLRADMDALPLEEETLLPFTSETKGAMHACGHDVHTTMLIGAAYLLAEQEFNGTIKFVFQPSEEGITNSPEAGKSGGQLVMESGLLNDASAAFGLHVHPLMPVGMIGFKNGTALAAAAMFKITIAAGGGHLATKRSADIFQVTAEIIQSANDYMSNKFKHNEGVVGFTHVRSIGEPTYNIVPQKMILQGTFRILDDEKLLMAKADLQYQLINLAKSAGVDIDLEFVSDYPALINDKVIQDQLQPVMEQIFGVQHIISGDAQLASEDFAFYAREIPSQFYFLGAQSPDNTSHFLHDPRVIFNEDCIRYGSQFLADGAVQLLKMS